MLRSFGKSYGLAGLRLGFAIGSATDCEGLRRAMGPWAVSGPAIAIGRRALADEAWRATAAARLRRDVGRLDGLLRRAGFGIVGGTLLFRLARHDASAVVFERLCRAGILTRAFGGKRDLLRFGIPGREVEWERLGAALGVALGVDRGR